MDIQECSLRSIAEDKTVVYGDLKHQNGPVLYLNGMQHQNGDVKHQNGGIRHQNGGIRHQNGDVKYLNGDVKHQNGDVKYLNGEIHNDSVGHQNGSVGHQNGNIVKSNVSEEPELKCPEIKGKKLVGVNGKWYDVTKFIAKHPGGPIIEEFIGKDATHAFYSYGHDGVLDRWKPVGNYTQPVRDPCDVDFDNLRKDFIRKGFFDTDYVWYMKKCSVPASLWLTSWFFVVYFNNVYLQLMGAVSLAFFWQQCGFLMHEFHHGQVTRKLKTDNIGGVLFGTICFGISSNWWRDEHIVHHAMTNTVDSDRRFADPQMWESVWAQNYAFFPLFNKLKVNDLLTYVKQRVQWCLIKIQHITFIPVVILAGRFEIVTDSFRKEKRWFEWAAWPFHWMWVIYLLSYLPDTRARVTFYCIAAWIQGLFHFQLILSHYCRQAITVNEFHKTSWYKYQILSNMNLECPKWMDWYYGGLNFHIEHHLFPKLARKHLREASTYVREICDKHNIEYDVQSFTGALIKTVVHLKNTKEHYSIYPT